MNETKQEHSDITFIYSFWNVYNIILSGRLFSFMIYLFMILTFLVYYNNYKIKLFLGDMIIWNINLNFQNFVSFIYFFFLKVIK